ncbi:MAG: patatin-like phospholipase family protein [Vitreoscilla sp.]|nr:patatin-like phospholipase family protein [Vitreoscilla sp.]
MSTLVAQRLAAPGPKKILACDGGGILGLISVEILARLEGELRTRTGRPELVLADWFDFVCGTSTGAIIAACISAGLSTEQIRRFYLDSGADMFHRASVFKRLKYGYDDEPLAAKLKRELNRSLGHAPDAPAALLGDPGLRTVLMMVLRNHSTDSPWPVSNNPLAKYNQLDRPDCNLSLPLWQLVRASTAAPTFFPPEVVSLAPGTPKEHTFVFVDGGVTTYNNPAFLAFQMATAAPYRMNWKTGTDQLMIVSVGTGGAARARPDLQAEDLWLLDHAKNIPGALMNAASAGWDMACRVVGDCRFGGALDREIGDMVAAPGEAPSSTVHKQFAYLRYDPDVSRAGLDALGLAGVSAEAVQVLDSIEHIDAIRRVGAAYAAQAVRGEHLRGFA